MGGGLRGGFAGSKCSVDINRDAGGQIMSLTTITQDNVTILAMRKRCDASQTRTLGDEVEARLDSGVTNLVFDFRDLDYINSSGLRVLLMALKRLRLRGGTVSVCCARDYIQEVFEISGYDKLFGMYATRSEAVAVV